MDIYSRPPTLVGRFDDIRLPEFMHYLYLPVKMEGGYCYPRLPPNLECVRSMVEEAWVWAGRQGRFFQYVYVSARRGWATPGNSLNRPGWHCDGFGTNDLNFLWWLGDGTRFALQKFEGIPTDHVQSMVEIEKQVRPGNVRSFAPGYLYGVDKTHVHATPEVVRAHERQFVKISLSNDPYNLDGNSHNHLFDYDWPMVRRGEIRNDPFKAQKDSA